MSECLEYIQCSACYFPDSDYILTGHRHWSVDMYWNAGYSVKDHKVFDVSRAMWFFEFKYETNDANEVPLVRIAKDHVQGFFTNTMRFVDRREGWKIAKAKGQIVHSIRGEDLNNLKNDGELFSENLW